MRENWATLWEAVSDAMPDATAVVQGGRRASYREVEQRAARLAAALHDLGVGPGGKVAILAYNCVEYLEAAYAAFKLRGTPVNLNFRYRAEELTEVLADAEADVLLFHGSLGATAREMAGRLPRLRATIRIDDGPPAGPDDLDHDDLDHDDLDHEVLDHEALDHEALDHEALDHEALDYEDLIAGQEPLPRAERSGDDEFMIYTGGTTGRPRGVVWRHADLVATVAYPAYMMAGLEPPADVAGAVRAATDLRGTGRALRVLPAPPLIHGTAFYLSMGAWLMGGTVVLLEGRRLDGHEIWRLVQRERVDQMVIVGDPFAKALVRALDEAERAGTPYDISSLRRVNSAGVLWSTASKQALADRGEMTLVDLVGASEGGPFSVQTVPPGAKAADCLFQLPPRTVLIDDDDRPIDPASGRTGRLAVGPPGPVGYFKDPAKSAELLREVDGVVHAVPGDYAYVEPDGRVVLLGRGALCINTGGEKVYPQEVETAIAQLPGVRDVNVFGLPDEQWGEAVTAVVAPDPDAAVTPDDVRRAVRDRLAGYKVPKHVVFVDDIRRSPAGKADYAWARAAADGVLGGG